MREQTTQEIQKPRDRAILAGLSSPRLDAKDNADEESMEELEALVGRSRGRPNKDLAQLASQIKQIMEKWDA